MSRNKELANDYDNNCDFSEVVRIIAKNLFICVEELKDAGYRYSDFSKDV